MLWPLAADDSGEGLRTPRKGLWHSVVSPMESKESVTGEGGGQTSHCGEGTTVTGVLGHLLSRSSVTAEISAPGLSQSLEDTTSLKLRQTLPPALRMGLWVPFTMVLESQR